MIKLPTMVPQIIGQTQLIKIDEEILETFQEFFNSMSDAEFLGYIVINLYGEIICGET